MRLKFVFGLTATTLLVGCTGLPTQPIHQSKTQTSAPSVSEPKTNANGVTITPYHPGEIKRTPVSPTVIVPKQAPQPSANDGSNLPAFKSTMAQAQAALKQQQYTQAERLATQAQRIAPQAAQSYVVLAQSALAQKQVSQAKALVLRGLSLASDDATTNQLLQIQKLANQGQK
ncbi:tetratricopeptide repeat protein [Acinetobacter sp. MD2]|uniref:tetratricopeptide repeat protein n=1 Tax=Acinetobacter sp. MD2 TaxID=2600066 RepID=UPI002D1E5C89|nr:tetratricopeptide repeat protein [Acinetobacter sp. MD2]MEB3767788.1 tetratricopeptide repeat protein [Acinetobacter sp. MD2]